MQQVMMAQGGFQQQPIFMVSLYNLPHPKRIPMQNLEFNINSISMFYNICKMMMENDFLDILVNENEHIKENVLLPD